MPSTTTSTTADAPRRSSRREKKSQERCGAAGAGAATSSPSSHSGGNSHSADDSMKKARLGKACFYDYLRPDFGWKVCTPNQLELGALQGEVYAAPIPQLRTKALPGLVDTTHFLSYKDLGTVCLEMGADVRIISVRGRKRNEEEIHLPEHIPKKIHENAMNFVTVDPTGRAPATVGTPETLASEASDTTPTAPRVSLSPRRETTIQSESNTSTAAPASANEDDENAAPPAGSSPHKKCRKLATKALKKEIDDEKKKNADLEQKFDAFRKQAEAERAQLRQQFQEKEYEYEMAKLNWQEKETKLQREILSLKRERSDRS